MSLKYGLTNPAAFKQSKGIYPDLFKFYSNYPSDTSQSTDDGKRHPQLFSSLNHGRTWINESISSLSNSFYQFNYGGNLYLDSSSGNLIAMGHKSSLADYPATRAQINWNGPHLGISEWDLIKSIPSTTSNTSNKEICRNFTSNSYPNRYFCMKDGGGYAYIDNPYNTTGWSITVFGTSNTIYLNDGGFKHLCIDFQGSHSIFVVLRTNDSNRYIRLYSCNADTVNRAMDYTSIALGNNTRKITDYKYLSIDYLPNVGFLIFYAYQNDNRFQVRILRTFDETTGERLAWNQFVADSHGSLNVGNANNKIVANGCRGWYCPWTKEYFFVPNPYQVFWSKDGINWSSSNATGLTATNTCVAFLTDGTNMMIADSTNSYRYSVDKGTTWTTGTTLSPDAFYLWGPNDRIVIPFKCTNNIFKSQPRVTLGYAFNNDTGEVVTNVNNFYTPDYFPVTPDTSYVFYGVNKTTGVKTRWSRICYYDNNKNWIGFQEGYSAYSGNNIEIPAIVKVPSNAAFVRFTCNPEGNTVTQQMVNSYKWYFAKEEDFVPMTEYGDIVCN